MSAWYGSAVPGERATSCGGRGYKKEAAIFVDVCSLSHHLRVVRRLVTARSSSLRRVPGTLCHPASLRLRHLAPSSVVWKRICLPRHSLNFSKLRTSPARVPWSTCEQLFVTCVGVVGFPYVGFLVWSYAVFPVRPGWSKDRTRGTPQETACQDAPWQTDWSLSATAWSN